jgi:hypothetical protein
MRRLINSNLAPTPVALSSRLSVAAVNVSRIISVIADTLSCSQTNVLEG